MAGTQSKAKQYLCLGCKQQLKRNTVSVPCQVCEEYTHPECSNITKELLQYLVDETKEGNSISWTCDHCKKVGKVLNNKVKVLAKEFYDLKKDFEGMQKKQKDLEEEMETVKQKCDKNNTDIGNSNSSVTTTVFSEIREREEKKNNVLVHGIPEAADDLENRVKKEKDWEWVKDIATDLEINLHKTDVKFWRRLGEKRIGKVRPLIVGFHELDVKKKILRNARKLKDIEDYEGIYLVPDLTIQQRKEEEELGREVLRKNAELEPEKALNYEWRLVGSKGEKRLVLAQKPEPEAHPSRGRGRGRGNRGFGRGRGSGQRPEAGRMLGRGRGRGRGGDVRGGGATRKRGRSQDQEITDKRNRPSVAEDLDQEYTREEDAMEAEEEEEQQTE